jgi:hypothetical protein
MFVQDVFLYLIVTRHKLTVCIHEYIEFTGNTHVQYFVYLYFAENLRASPINKDL